MPSEASTHLNAERMLPVLVRKAYALSLATFGGLVNETGRVEVQWIRIGAVVGLWACLAYPAMVFLRLPLAVTAAVAASFGPALAIACVGLWRLIRLHHGSVAAGAAAGLNALGGALFTAMVLVQMAIGVVTGNHSERALQAIWLGLDVAWDAYIGLGTVLFAFSMLRHPRFGRVFAVSGVAVGSTLLLFNLYTFPTPPANAGLIDLGPVIGIWYFAVTVQMWRSLKWAEAAVGGENA